MSSFSRNFVTRSLLFFVVQPADPAAILAISPDFMSGSFAPEVAVKHGPSWAFLWLALKFSSTIQFATALEFSEPRVNPRICGAYTELIVQLVQSTRYFTRQLVRLDMHDLPSSEMIVVCLPLLRALRSLQCTVQFYSEKKESKRQEDNLVKGLRHLDLDELNLTLRGSITSENPTNILSKIWTENPMRRLRTLSLRYLPHLDLKPTSQLALRSISDFHPNLFRLSLLMWGKLSSVPDFTVMNQLEALRLQGFAFGSGEPDLQNLDVKDLNDFFPVNGNNSSQSRNSNNNIDNNETASTATTYCDHLTELVLDHHFPEENVKFFVRKLGRSDMMKRFYLARHDEGDPEDLYVEKSVRADSPTGPFQQYSVSSSFVSTEYLDLLTVRYPLLESLHLADCRFLTDKNVQMIQDNMMCLRSLTLPIDSEPREIASSPTAAQVLSLVHSAVVSGLEYLVLPENFDFTLKDVVSVFGLDGMALASSSSSSAAAKSCLKKLHANRTCFTTLESFLTFLGNFCHSLEFVSLPLIEDNSLNLDDADDNPDAVASDDGLKPLPAMPHLKEIFVDVVQSEICGPAYYYSALLPLLLQAAPHLEVFSIEDSQEEHPAFGGATSWYDRLDSEDLDAHLTNLFHRFANNFEQDTSKHDFLTIVLGHSVAEVCSTRTWAEISRIKSLRRVLVSATREGEDGSLEAFPASAFLFRTRPDVLMNFTFKAKTSRKRSPTATKKKPKSKTKKDVSSKKKTTKKPVAKKSVKKGTKKTAAAGKKTKVAPKKVTKAKKPVAKKTISTKKKPTAKKTTKKKKPVAKKATTKKSASKIKNKK